MLLYEAVTYVSLVASFLSVWLTVCAAVDRVAVLYRGGRTSFSSCTRARFVTVALLWFALPVYLNISILIDVAQTYVGPLCTVLHDYYDMMQVNNALSTDAVVCTLISLRLYSQKCRRITQANNAKLTLQENRQTPTDKDMQYN